MSTMEVKETRGTAVSERSFLQSPATDCCPPHKVTRRLSYKAGDTYYRVLRVCEVCGAVVANKCVPMRETESL